MSFMKQPGTTHNTAHSASYKLARNGCSSIHAQIIPVHKHKPFSYFPKCTKRGSTSPPLEDIVSCNF